MVGNGSTRKGGKCAGSATTAKGTKGAGPARAAAHGEEGRAASIAERAESMAELLAGLNAFDDALFRVLAEDGEVLQEILRAALGDGGLTVVEVVPQRSLGVPGARGVAVDVLCQTAEGELVAVEVQKQKEDDPPRRVRYVRSSTDTWMVARGTEFAEVPRLTAVYLCRSDPFGAGLVLYHVDKVVRETGQRVDDGTLDVYASAACAAGGTDLERLLRYMVRTEGDLEGFPALSARVQYYKQSTEGRGEMSDLFDQFVLEITEEAEARGKAEGRAEGEAKGKAEGVLRSLGNLMANLGLTADAAMDALGVPEADRADYRAKLA